jgi:outer membrane receptor protein involved in Fe transport
VVGATPLGAELDIAKAPAPIQTARGADIDRSHSLDLSAFMSRDLRGVYVNDVQNNPLQPDINYRGFTASPLLGTAQGLSVYVDGVRFNQPFGDVVSWDLIPRQAIAEIALIPGSNPLFGLNTLGGALSVRTKDGRSDPGGMVQLSYGSYDRRLAEAEIGGVLGDIDGYLTASLFHDDGWRDASPSKAGQVFGKLGWRDASTRVALSGAYARTNLTGNGLQEQRFLARDRSSVYTKPDVTRNRSGLANLTFEHDAGGGLTLTGDAYYRQIRTRTLNGDLNDDSLTESVYQPNADERAALAAAGFTGVPISGESAANTPFPAWRCIANVLLNAEPGETCDGLLNRTRTRQREAGASVQAAWRSDWNGRENQFVVGAAYKQTRARFRQSSQYGYLTPDRGVVGVDGPGAFADGTQESEDALDARVDLTGRTRTFSVYAADTLDLTPQLTLTLSARYDADRIRDRDAITPGGGPGSLDGDHRFSRINPAAGVTWRATAAVTAYASLSQGGRAPSVIELGCADPDNPCRLPNALAGDPPLRQVRTRTAEVGLRGEAGGLTWNAGLFRAENHADILFVADDVSGFGYFKNFGRTRREGAELGVSGRWGRISAGANYTYLRATYRTAETVGGTGNSTNDIGPGFEGDIAIRPGDRIPLIPRHLFKAQLGWELSKALSLSADMVASSGVYARGNENNAHQPDGVFYLGPGRTKGYAVFNLGADYRPTKTIKLFVQVSNVFDAKYATAAQLGATGFTDTGAFIARPFAGPVIDGDRPVRSATFFAPGAPRMVWAGVRYEFGR